MAAYPTPPQDSEGVLALLDHLWSISAGVGTMTIAVIYWFIRRIRWADSVMAALVANREAVAGAVVQINSRFDQIQREAAEIRADIHDTNARIDNVLVNKPKH